MRHSIRIKKMTKEHLRPKTTSIETSAAVAIPQCYTQHGRPGDASATVIVTTTSQRGRNVAQCEQSQIPFGHLLKLNRSHIGIRLACKADVLKLCASQVCFLLCDFERQHL